MYSLAIQFFDHNKPKWEELVFSTHRVCLNKETGMYYLSKDVTKSRLEWVTTPFHELMERIREAYVDETKHPDLMELVTQLRSIVSDNKFEMNVVEFLMEEKKFGFRHVFPFVKSYA